jgi:DNA-binding NarL/FixJ family response regulator
MRPTESSASRDGGPARSDAPPDPVLLRPSSEAETVGKIRVFLADDHALVRSGLRALLEAEPDLEVIGEAGDGEDAVKQVAALSPDVVLMDLIMPRLSGLEATAQISASTCARVLVLTMHRAEEYLVPVLRAGGSGYLTKESADRELIDAIRTVASGEVFLYPSAARLLLENFRGLRDEDREANPLHLLSARELEVLKKTARGFSATEIAEGLRISPKTVDTYRQRGMEKLKLHHRSELVQFALQNGLLSTSEA